MPSLLSIQHSAIMTVIGVLDSGVGGLSVLREIHAQHPHLRTLYFADQAHLPYGPRDPAQVRHFIERITRFLLDEGAQGIVIPCHTACAAGLHSLRAQHPALPIVGLEPAVKPAASATKSGVIGVLTTEATARSAMYASLIERFTQGVRVMTTPAPQLVLLAEAGAPDTDDSRALVAAHVTPMLEAGADQIVLACTHFPFLTPLLRPLIDGRAALVDPSAAVARQVGRVMAAASPYLMADDGEAPHAHRYYTTGDADAFSALASRWMAADVRAEGIAAL
jgi:glutamate racemase